MEATAGTPPPLDRPWNRWVLRAQEALEENPPGEHARGVVLRAMEL